MNRLTFCVALAAAILAGPVRAADAPGPAALPLTLAEQMINTCTELTATDKLPALSVVVIDISGTMIAFRRQDGASPASSDAALLKARTALRTRMPSGTLGAAVAQDPLIRDVLIELQLTGVAGGVLVKNAAGDVIGAVGASGGAPLEDERCAAAAAVTIMPRRAK
jgi:glc operon protein GlcG